LVGKVAYATQDHCHALALSGGGSKGAYEAGVLWGLTHYDDPTKYTWDVVSGVSAGSINVGGVCLWEVGQEKEMTEWLGDLWENLVDEDIYTKWTGGIVAGLTLHEGIYNNDHMEVYLNDIF
jgi:predicted acylesterase/phospholipase RssA